MNTQALGSIGLQATSQALQSTPSRQAKPAMMSADSVSFSSKANGQEKEKKGGLLKWIAGLAIVAGGGFGLYKLLKKGKTDDLAEGVKQAAEKVREAHRELPMTISPIVPAGM